MTYEEKAKNYHDFYPIQYQILVDGENIFEKYSAGIISLTFEDAVDVSHRFSFTVSDQKLSMLENDVFELGKPVEIKMGYLDNLQSMIAGEIISLRPTFPQSGSPQLEVSGYDWTFQLTRGNKYRSWQPNKRDSEVVQDIIKTAAMKHKLQLKIEPTKVIFPKIIKDNETDYKFIKFLAKRNFFEFSSKGKDVYFGPPRKSEQPILTLEYGRSLLSFTPELNSANQVSEVVVRGWDDVAKKEITGNAKNQTVGEETSGGALVDKLYGNVPLEITDMPVRSPQEANSIARSIFEQLSVGLVRGTGECVGMPEIRAGTILVLKGMGKKFSQKYYVERSTHTISSSGYYTTFNVRGAVV